MARAPIAAAIVLIVFGGCTNEKSRPEDTSPSISSTGGCESSRRVFEDPALRVPGAVDVDVDGDGVPERVGFAVDRAGEAGCRAFLVAAGDTFNAIIPVTGAGGEPVAGRGLPALSTVAAIDARPGVEVVVTVGLGSSTRLLAVFTAVDGALERVTISIGKAPPDDVFAAGGSLEHAEAIDCLAPGEVVVSTAEARGPRSFVVSRAVVAAKEEMWIGAPSYRTRTIPADDLTERFPEFTREPFASCDAPAVS